MGLPIDEIHFCVTRIRHHLHLLVTQNPIPFAVFFFMLILYAFLPCVFRVLLHCFPVLVMVTLAVVFSLDRRASHGAALNVNVNAGESSQENNGFPESPMCQSGEKTYKRAHSVRRRNARLSKDRFNNIATPQEKDAVAAAAASATADDDAVDKPETSTAATTTTTTMSEEKKGKEILRVDKRVEKLRRGNNKEDEHEDDEEKNSMDIAGLSEAERTTRLESLMAKRRARKMLSIQLRKALVKMGKNDPRAQFASILIPKSIPNAPTSPIPVEAPCVLFPSRNPFDIPYDSHEEKPNLSADDFDKEFVANQTNPHQDPNTDAIFIPSSSSSNPEPTLHNIEPENTNLHEDEHERGPETISQDVSSIEDKGSGSGSGSGSKRSKEVQEFREQDIMDVVFSGLEPILEQDLDESDPSMTNISINMRNHDHEIDKRIQESRKGKAIVEDNSTSEADDIPYNNGKEIIDYIKETYDDEQQRSNQPSSSSSSSTCNNQNNNGVPVPITDQNQRDPFAASSSHSNNNEEQQDVQQEMVVGEGSYDSSSSSSTSSSSTTTHDKLIQTDQDSSNSHQPTNEMPPKHDQSESSTMEDSTRFNLEIGTGQTSTQETIPCSTEEIEVIKEDEADSDEINKKEI